MQWRWSLYLHICDSIPICKKCCSVYEDRYTLDDNSECPMDYEFSLLSNVFPWRECSDLDGQ